MKSEYSNAVMKYVLISFSLTNLLFYKVFVNFYSIFEHQPNQYFNDAFPAASDYIAAISNVFLVTLILIPIVRYASVGRLIIIRWGAGLIQTILFLIATYWFLRTHSIIPIGIFGRARHVALGLSLEHTDFIMITALLGLFIMASIFIFLGRRWFSSLRSFQNALLLVLAPFGLFTLLQMTYWFATESTSVIQPAFSQSVFPVSKTASPKSRVVIVIFDELDFRLSFVERPLSVSLSELDRLAAQSVFSANAYPPSNATSISIPSLTTSRILTATTPIGASELMLQEAGVTMTWRDSPNLFSIAKKLDVNIALVGWAHPYCRIFSDVINNCNSHSGTGLFNTDESVSEKMYFNLRSVIETPNFSIFGQSVVTQRAARLYETMLNQSLNVVADERYGLVYLHFSIPHAPTIFNSTTGKLNGGNSPVAGYLDNLNLVDVTLGRLRVKLEETGQWDNTTLLLTSDHWWRFSKQLDGKADHRVPFVIKTKNQQDRLDFRTTFNTFIMSDLVIDLLKGDTSNSEEVFQFISKNGSYEKPLEVPGFN
jgi:hypothetical protein